MFCRYFFVVYLIFINFVGPEFHSAFWQPSIFAFPMSMPEAPMHKNYLFSFGKDYVRLAGKVTNVYPKPVAHLM
jgi:hypothetical protein